MQFAAALSLDQRTRARFVELSTVSGFTFQAIGQWANSWLTPNCAVLSDGLGCFPAFITAGCTHQTMMVGDRKLRDLPQFLWFNIVLGNLKSTLADAYHSLKHCN